jgi:hypothetical protein
MYRIKAIKQLTGQLNSNEGKIDPYNLTLKELLSLPLSTLDWQGVYKIKEEE